MSPLKLPNVLAIPNVVPAKSCANSLTMGYLPSVMNPRNVILAIDNTIIKVLSSPRNGIVNRHIAGHAIA